MKNIFKKIAVVALAMIMCVGAAMPVTFAEDAKCPGAGKTHAAGNCDYRVIAQAEASCEAVGFVTAQCTGCSVTFVLNSTEELGHDWETGEVSCLSATKKTCKRCGKVEELPGSATGHAYGEWITKGENGCFKGNRRYQVCSLCGHTNEEKMTDDHSWIIAAYEAPVICTAPGRATYACENKDCGATRTAQLWDKAEGASHNYKDWNISESDANYSAVVKLTKGAKDPNAAVLSCTTDGAKTQICIDCGVTRVIYTAASTYQHTLKDMKFIEATLDTSGCRGTFKSPIWECYYCGIKFLDTKSDAYDDTDITVKESYYAKYGTITPVIKDDAYDRLSDEEKAEYYWIYSEYNWLDYDDMPEDIIFVDNARFDKATAPKTLWSFGHSGKYTKAATCTEPGIEEVNCNKCGIYSFKTLEPLGHLYYPDVTKDADKDDLLTRFGISYQTTDSSKADYYTKVWTAAGNLGKATGSGTIWAKVILPTCTESAKVVWNCLNSTSCKETKEVALTGSRNKAYGHKMTESVVLSATCTTSGLCDEVCVREVESYSFVGGVKTFANEYDENNNKIVCDRSARKSVPALGHAFVKDTANVLNKAVSCKEDGVQWYKCSNAGCTETKEETIVSTGAEHLWNFAYGYLTENTTVNCISGVSGYAICTKCDMLVPQLVEKAPLGHKFVEIDEDALKILKKQGDKLYVDALGNYSASAGTGKVLAAEYTVQGTCLESAVYRVNCLNDGCAIYQTVEPDKDTVKEGHDIVVLNSWYDVNGVYDADLASNANEYNTTATMIVKLSCTSKTYGNLWYCKNENCADYRVEDLTLKTDSKWVDADGNAKAPNKFEFYATHNNPETNEAIKYTDVPDERISGAESLAEAQKVKAPVDENGNIIAVAVEIPGTSLVWRYVVDDVTCDVDQVTVGGFYCVNCTYTGEGKAIVGLKRADYHDVKKVGTYDASCLTYGYTLYNCKNCDYVLHTDFEPMRAAHVIDYTKPVSTIAATCEKSGANVYQCADENCRVFVTTITAPLGHYNVSGDELLTSCLDLNANIENRRCKNCSHIILSDHNYVDGRCKDCGRIKED